MSPTRNLEVILEVAFNSSLFLIDICIPISASYYFHSCTITIISEIFSLPRERYPTGIDTAPQRRRFLLAALVEKLNLTPWRSMKA